MRYRHMTVITMIAATLLPVLKVHAQNIQLDMNFDSGSLGGYSVSGDLISVQGRDNFYPGKWKWVYFRAQNVAGRQLTFQMGDNFASGAARLSNHKMVYSYDQETWHFFDNNHLNTVEHTYTFSNSAAFESNSIYIAYGLPYSYQRSVDMVQRTKNSPWVSPTSSADSNLVIGQSPGGSAQTLGTITGRDMHGFTITDSSIDSSRKKKIVLMSGLHPNETLAGHTLEGFVDFALSNDARAQALRREAEIYVYPMANPDGRFAGYNRSTVQSPNVDPNRVWGPSEYASMPDIKTVAEAMLADTGGDVDYFIDFHSYTNTGNHFAYLDSNGYPSGSDMRQTDFWQALLDLEPSLWVEDTNYPASGATHGFGWHYLNADVSLTLETMFRPDENIDRYNDLGRHVAIAIETATPPVPEPATLLLLAGSQGLLLMRRSRRS